MGRITQREWFALLRAEARRQRAPEAQRASLPVIHTRAAPDRVTPVAAMPLPPCLCRPDTEAGRARMATLADRHVIFNSNFWSRGGARKAAQ